MPLGSLIYLERESSNAVYKPFVWLANGPVRIASEARAIFDAEASSGKDV